MNFDAYPSLQNDNKINLNKKLKESRDLNIAIEKWKSKGGVIQRIKSIGSIPKYLTFHQGNASTHKTA